MDRVTKEHREAVAEGRIARVGGYTAATDAELDRLEQKLGGSDESSDSEDKLPTEAQMKRWGLDRLRAQAEKEDIRFSEEDDKGAVVKAILDGRQAE